MSPWGHPDTFTVAQPKTDVFAPAGGWQTAMAPVSPWTTKLPERPSYADDEALKRRFGVEWARAEKPWEAACKVFKTDTGAALWIASNWLNDPVVIAARDTYLKTVEAERSLLDKDGFAAMLMQTALEKSAEGRYAIEAKERVNILKLYAEVRGFLNKSETNVNNFVNNEGLKVVFVRPEPITIAQSAPTVSNTKSEISNDGPSPLRIKLVG
jgi:hypothetical protein